MERRPQALCSGRAGQKGAPAPLWPPPPRKPPRHPDQRARPHGRGRCRGPQPGPTAFPCPAPCGRSTQLPRPRGPARAGAGSSPARPPAPLPLGTQPIGQAGGPPRPDWWGPCLSRAVGLSAPGSAPPPIAALENSSRGIPGVSLPEAGFKSWRRLRS